ncbi:MAG: hypothetical protein F6K11_19995 [Leptolyngbya sp. SIO3F4]|nr:hypothetical protein [Leptolyngbya sp. SIO3F4]
MKRYFLSTLTVLIAAVAIAPAAQANALHTARLQHLDTQTKAFNRQASSSSELSEDATFHDLVRHNRRVRNKS